MKVTIQDFTAWKLESSSVSLESDFSGMEKKNKELVLQVLREGTKNIVLVNFLDICKSMRRPPHHLKEFLLARLGTTGYVDGQHRLVVEGGCRPKKCGWILSLYRFDYVRCTLCASHDTILSKGKEENGYFILLCEKCGGARLIDCALLVPPFELSGSGSGSVAPVG